MAPRWARPSSSSTAARARRRRPSARPSARSASWPRPATCPSRAARRWPASCGFRDNEPEVWAATAMFGHCNTYLTRRLTGSWAIDPSTTSITGLYATARHDLTWNADVLDAAGLGAERLPPADAVLRPGRARSCRRCARELGLPSDVRRPVRRQRRDAGGVLGRPHRPGRRQHHQRHLRHRQRVHRPAGLVARRSTSARTSSPAAGSRSSCSTPAARRSSGSARRFCRELDERRLLRGRTCPPCCVASSPSTDIDDREAALPIVSAVPGRQPLLARAAHGRRSTA